MVEDDVAGRVTRAVADVEGEVADGRRVLVFQPAVGREWLAGDAVLAAVLLQRRDPEHVLFVRALDRNAELFGEDAGRAAMVDMAMSQKDFLDRDAHLLRGRPELRKVAARIDEGRLHRLSAPQQSAVLLERR